MPGQGLPFWTCSDCDAELPQGEKAPCQRCGSKRRTANFSIHSEVRADANVKTYVARASGNTVVDSAFLAFRAITHPNQTLFLEVSPGGEGKPPVWAVRPIGSVAEASEPVAVAAPEPVAEAPSEEWGPAPDAGIPTIVPGAPTHVADAPSQQRVRKKVRDANRTKNVAARQPNRAENPALTPGFNFSLLAVFVLTLIALFIQVAMGFVIQGQETELQKQLFSTTDWILKLGVGAFVGLLGGKRIK